MRFPPVWFGHGIVREIWGGVPKIWIGVDGFAGDFIIPLFPRRGFFLGSSCFEKPYFDFSHFTRGLSGAGRGRGGAGLGV